MHLQCQAKFLFLSGGVTLPCERVGLNQMRVGGLFPSIGHALGNQHWPALVKGTRVFVPLTVDHKVMASVMKTHRFEGIRYEFVPGEDIGRPSVRVSPDGVGVSG